DVGSYPPLPIEGTTLAGNTPGKSSYANVTRKPSGKKLNIRTLFTPGGNGIDVVVSVESIRTISDRFANTAYGFFLGSQEAYHVVANYVKNTWGKYELVRSMFSSSTRLISFQFSSIKELVAMLENDPCDDGLNAIATKLGTPLMLDSYTSDMCMQSWGRIQGEGHYTCNVRVEYEWKRPRCSSCKVFGHIHEECPKNTGADEKKTVKKPSQISRGVPKAVEPTIEVSNSNPFDVLNSVDNDVEFGINVGYTNLVNNGATSSGSSFMNTDNDGEFVSNTPIGEKIDNIQQQFCKGKLRLLDNDRNPLVPTGIMESDREVEVTFDETANLGISMNGKDRSDKGYGTNSLLEKWRDSYLDNDDYDPYDYDMCENHDLSEHLQSICDDLDITVRDRKKK
ncbi:hypothetical protein Tco_1058212, partial [Tanacetum coccineum]